MRKLTLLLIAFALALYAHFLGSGAGAMANSVILFTIAAALFAWGAGPALPLPMSVEARTWPLGGRVLAALALAFSALSSVAGMDSLWGLAGWALALILLAAAVWWQGEQEVYAAPAYRWTTDAAGRWVRAILAGADTLQPGSQPVATMPHRHALLVPMVAVLAAGAVLRLWRLGDLPPGCVAAECEAALRLAEAAPSLTTLYDLLAHFLFRITADGLASLRLAGALIGIITLPVFYWAARPLERAGGAALVAMLLALLPWHIWASRASDPWITIPLLIALAAGTGLRAFANVDRRWWWAAGLAAGLLVLDAGPARGPSLLWALVMLALAAWRLAAAPVSPSARIYSLATWLAAASVIAVPGLPRLFGASTDSTTVAAASGLLAGLLQGGGAVYGYFLDNPLLTALPGALAALGLGQLLRSLHRPHAALIVAGAVAYGLYLIRGDTRAAAMASQALSLLPFLLLAAVIALDTLLFTFWRTWQALAPARTVLGAALTVVLITGGWQLFSFNHSLAAASIADRSVDEAIGRHAAACLLANTYAACVHGGESAGDPEEYAPVIYAPAAAIDHPSTRLSLGANLDSTRLRVLDVARDVPPDPLPDGPALYLTPIDDQPSVDLLLEFYPNAEVVTLPRDAGPSQFVAVAVERSDLLERQGIEGHYFTGTEFGTPEMASMSSCDGPLAFDWQENPPLPGAFSVLWEGSLQAPAAGSYRFSVDLPATSRDGQAAFTLQLDDRLVLDTSLGLLEKEEILAHGFYRLAMRFRTDARTDQPPSDWSVRWQLPGADPVVIPREALFSPALPDVGLLGTYYGGDTLQGPALTTRKDLVLGAQADLPAPYSVRWQGKLAAPRAGEYLFTVTGSGDLQMLIDGREVITYAPDQADAEMPLYAHASVYLPQGWHDIVILYVPDEKQPDFRILWQPPGSGPSLLPARYLRPELGQIFASDAALPAAPELIDSSLGDDAFALSFTSELIRPQTIIPPSDLPLLFFEEVWFSGGSCGSGAGQLSTPRGVAVDADARRVYVADTGNRRVLVYDLENGEPVDTYTGQAFEEPVDLAIGPDGNLIVLDAVAHPLSRIDTASGEVAPIPVDATFYRPRGLDVDALGHILVADTGGARVVMLDPQGQLLAHFGGQGTALGAGQPVDALEHDGTLWAVTAEDGRLWRLYDESGLTALPSANTMDGPHLAGLPGRGFFLSDPVSRGIRYHASDGEPLLQFAYPEAFIAPVGLAAAEVDGMVYLVVADSATCAISVWRGAADQLQR